MVEAVVRCLGVSREKGEVFAFRLPIMNHRLSIMGSYVTRDLFMKNVKRGQGILNAVKIAIGSLKIHVYSGIPGLIHIIHMFHYMRQRQENTDKRFLIYMVGSIAIWLRIFRVVQK